MAYPTPFLRLVLSGTLHGFEQFSVGLSLIPSFNGDPTDDAPDEVPASVITAVENFWESGNVSNRAPLTTLKLNMIDTNGRYLNQGNTVVHDFGTPGIYGGGQFLYPPQVALAVTLRTRLSRGRAHAGRFYLPSPSAQVQDDGRITEIAATDIATDVVTFIDALNAALPNFRVGVASDVGSGAMEPVTGVTVGRTLDTIRSRRTSIPEAYPPILPVAT